MQPTVNDVLTYCQGVYGRMRFFPATEDFIGRFNVHVSAIGRTVCHEQGVPFAMNNGLPNNTPLGTASAQLFTDLQQMVNDASAASNTMETVM